MTGSSLTTPRNQREAIQTCRWQLLAPQDGKGRTHTWVSPCNAVGEDIYRSPFYREDIYLPLVLHLEICRDFFCRLHKFGDFSKTSFSSMATDYDCIILEKSI